MTTTTFDKELLFIKLGGSAITKKGGDHEVNSEVLTRLAKELAWVYKNYNVVLGHGSGSFGHKAAVKYKVKEGECTEEGWKKIHEAAAELNKIVVDNLKGAEVPATSVHSSLVVMDSKELSELPITINKLLENGEVPIVYGDVVFDGEYKIFSTEMFFSFLSKELKPARIILGTNVEGVFDGDPDEEGTSLVKEINSENFDSIISKVSGSKVTDVTGGMADKVKKMYRLAKTGPTVHIINLLKEDYLKRAVQGESLGTIIK